MAKEERLTDPANKSARYALKLLRDRLDASDRFKRDSIVRPVFEKFVEDGRVGGIPGIAGFLGETHQIAKDTQVFARRHHWAVFLRDLIKDIDTNTKDAIEMEMDPEELHLQMVGGLMEMIRKDPEFASAIIMEAASTIVNAKDGKTRLGTVLKSIEYVRQGNPIENDIFVAGEVDGKP